MFCFILGTNSILTWKENYNSGLSAKHYRRIPSTNEYLSTDEVNIAFVISFNNILSWYVDSYYIGGGGYKYEPMAPIECQLNINNREYHYISFL